MHNFLNPFPEGFSSTIIAVFCGLISICHLQLEDKVHKE